MTYSVAIIASIRIALALDEELHLRSNKLLGLFFRLLYTRKNVFEILCVWWNNTMHDGGLYHLCD